MVCLLKIQLNGKEFVFVKVYLFLDDYFGMCGVVDQNISKFRIKFWQRWKVL
jgi:hypothetical protein